MFNWRSIIDTVERHDYNVEKSWKLLNIFITNSRMSTGSCHIAIEEIPGGKGNDFGKKFWCTLLKFLKVDQVFNILPFSS